MKLTPHERMWLTETVAELDRQAEGLLRLVCEVQAALDVGALAPFSLRHATGQYAKAVKECDALKRRLEQEE